MLRRHAVLTGTRSRWCGQELGIAIGFNLSEGQRCVGDLVIAPGDEDADHYMFLDLAKSPETLAGKERVMLNIKMIRTRK